MKEDIRWQQRFQNFELALAQLTSAVALHKERGLSDLEQQGLIQAFEYTHELAWKVIKDFLEYQGESNIIGSRDAFRKAYNVGLITDAESWMESIVSRNRSSHTYNRATAIALVAVISTTYHMLFAGLQKTLSSRVNNA